MKTKTALLILLIIIAVVSAGLLQRLDTASAEDKDSSAIAGKLQTVIDNQQEILAMLDEMKKELNIIKVRATR
ncbi:MAG: hypothetical protein HQ572_01955 [Candidatus Omnitrophica bacterium]|nr:hypothetical protein [Candidatus Omnitrophota bacterium]